MVSNVRGRSPAQSTRRTAKDDANYCRVIVRVRPSAKLFPQRLKNQSEMDISSPSHHLVQESVRIYSSPSIHGWSGPLPPPEIKQITLVYHCGDCTRLYCGIAATAHLCIASARRGVVVEILYYLEGLPSSTGRPPSDGPLRR